MRRRGPFPRKMFLSGGFHLSHPPTMRRFALAVAAATLAYLLYYRSSREQTMPSVDPPTSERRAFWLFGTPISEQLSNRRLTGSLRAIRLTVYIPYQVTACLRSRTTPCSRRSTSGITASNCTRRPPSTMRAFSSGYTLLLSAEAPSRCRTRWKRSGTWTRSATR